MVNGKFVSVKMIADRLMQNPIMKDLNFEFIIDHTVECMRLVNMPPIYVSKLEKITINKHKGNIPIDLMYINQVYDSSFGGLIPMNAGQDILHDHYSCLPNGQKINEHGGTYTKNNSKIFTSFEIGEVTVEYKAIATDEDCFPLIPDNVKLIRAIEAYIRFRWYDILHDMGKVSGQILDKVETEYAFNIGQAQSDLIMPDESEMEALVNSITKILPSRYQMNDRMKYLGTRQFLKTH